MTRSRRSAPSRLPTNAPPTRPTRSCCARHAVNSSSMTRCAPGPDSCFPIIPSFPTCWRRSARGRPWRAWRPSSPRSSTTPSCSSTCSRTRPPSSCPIQNWCDRERPIWCVPPRSSSTPVGRRQLAGGMPRSTWPPGATAAWPRCGAGRWNAACRGGPCPRSPWTRPLPMAPQPAISSRTRTRTIRPPDGCPDGVAIRSSPWNSRLATSSCTNGTGLAATSR